MILKNHRECFSILWGSFQLQDHILIPSAMTGFIVSVFPFRNRVSLKEALEWLELGEGRLSGPVLRGSGGRKAAWPLGSYPGSRAGLVL